MTSARVKKASAFEKRVKRQVGARSHTFFVTVSPGLEPFCLAELKTLFPDDVSFRPETGGITFEGRLEDLYRANLHLRTATRVLMRLGAVRATTFSQLEKELADVPWELHLPARNRPRVRVTVHGCRLYHSDAVAQRVANAAEQRLLAQPPAAAFGTGESPPQTIFVLGRRDRFTLSLDSSGQPLYQRGIKTHGGRAPLRETLAAAILMQAGYQGERPLVDPMCGTGTFSLEAAMVSMGLPAGGFREFAFMDWAAFQKGRWQHLKREARTIRRTGPTPPILATDLDSAACRKLARSLQRAGMERTVSLACADFFSLTPGMTGLVVINPPYGRRLGGPAQSRDLFKRICRHLVRKWTGWQVGLIAPDHRCVGLAPPGLTPIHLKHGGLKLTLLTGTL